MQWFCRAIKLCIISIKIYAAIMVKVTFEIKNMVNKDKDMVRESISKQGIIQKKSASSSRALPYLVTFIWNFILIWKCQKWSLNRGTVISATAI